jgi:sugar lactone lactonase YvrE
MLVPSARRALLIAAALFIAGCSGGNVVSSAGLSSPVAANDASHAASGYRMIPGPAVIGPMLVPINPPQHRGWISRKKSAATLFVGDSEKNVVNLYDPNTPNPSPEGSISSGLDAPIGLAVDKSGTLYVVNISNNTVTEYPPGATTPSFTINSGMDSPYGIAVDSSGDVFVSNLGNNTVSAYKPGSTTPYASISNVGPNPVGMGVDSKDNIYVCDDSNNTVYEIPAGTTTAQNSGLTALVGPIGIAFNKKNTAYVSNFGGNNVAIYPAGSTSPSGTITSGIDGPTQNGFTKKGLFFQSNQGVNVVGYKKNANTPFSTITGLENPTGIASSPRVK